MTLIDLLAKGYFPKELPPCFYTELFANNYTSIANDAVTNENASLVAFQNVANTMGLTNAQKNEQKLTRKQIFKTRINFSDSVQYSIPKSGLARNVVKITNPLNQGKLADVISANYTAISLLCNDSKISTTKPQIETELGENKRAVKHENYGFLKRFV